MRNCNCSLGLLRFCVQHIMAMETTMMTTGQFDGGETWFYTSNHVEGLRNIIIFNQIYFGGMSKSPSMENERKMYRLHRYNILFSLKNHCHRDDMELKCL